MSWKNSTRKQRLPRDWNSRRKKVLRRDNFRCQEQGPGCNGFATDVDHIVRGDNHDLSNLRSLCSVCHRKKTLAEAQEAKALKRSRRFRPVERHPGAR